jgi:hypothetical protein
MQDMQRREEVHIGLGWGNLNERDHMEVVILE